MELKFREREKKEKVVLLFLGARVSLRYHYGTFQNTRTIESTYAGNVYPFITNTSLYGPVAITFLSL